MADDKLRELYGRLRDELANAYSARPWRSEVIDRLADDIAAVEVAMARRMNWGTAAAGGDRSQADSGARR